MDLFCQGGASSILVHGTKVSHFISHVETVLLNEMLIKFGYAKFESQPPNVKYNERFRKARNEAVAKKKAFGKMSSRSNMKNKKLLILWMAVLFIVVGLSLVYAQDKIEEMDVDTNAYELPSQGTIIPCELCVILYPEHYEKEPQTCPICQGAKEHFQPAQMMTRKMAQMQLYELDLKIQQLMYQTIMGSLSEPVDLDQLKKMRKIYKRKLIHLLVYDFLEVEPVKGKICQLDEVIEFIEKTKPN